MRAPAGARILALTFACDQRGAPLLPPDVPPAPVPDDVPALPLAFGPAVSRAGLVVVLAPLLPIPVDAPVPDDPTPAEPPPCAFSADIVCASSWPLPGMPCACWKRRTARSVCGPQRPSTGPGSKPRWLNACCTWRTVSASCVPASADAAPRPPERLVEALLDPLRAPAEAPPRVVSRSVDDAVPPAPPLVMLPLPPDVPLLMLPLPPDVPLPTLPERSDDPAVAPVPLDAATRSASARATSGRPYVRDDSAALVLRSDGPPFPLVPAALLVAAIEVPLPSPARDAADVPAGRVSDVARSSA